MCRKYCGSTQCSFKKQGVSEMSVENIEIAGVKMMLIDNAVVRITQFPGAGGLRIDSQDDLSEIARIINAAKKAGREEVRKEIKGCITTLITSTGLWPVIKS
jgi:hypothetical protein